jgi:hypothetical protein
VSKCTTHHHACDCREAATRKLVNELLLIGTDSTAREWWNNLHAEAVRLGYVQGRSDRPAAQGEGEG